jgi:site-specific DNA recombinase
VVREVYRLYLQPGQNGLTIARELNRRGALQRNGRAEWQPAAITRMLSMTDYRGVHHYGVHGPRETITHPVPAIVDDQTWHQARALAAERKRRATRNTRRDYLLRGLLRCGRCGKTLDAYTVYRGYGTYSYYRCTSQTDPRRVFRGEAHCGLPQIPCAQADAVAWRHAETVIHDPDALERVLAASPAPQVGRQEQDELTAVRKELAELRQGRKRLLTILAEGLADEGEVRSALSTLRSNEGALQAREAALTTRLESCTETLLARDEMRGLVAAIRAELAHGVTYPRQRASLLGLARHFTVEEWERGRDLVLRPHWSFTI